MFSKSKKKKKKLIDEVPETQLVPLKSCLLKHEKTIKLFTVLVQRTFCKRPCTQVTFANVFPVIAQIKGNKTLATPD